jgi:hypothetical protein
MSLSTLRRRSNSRTGDDGPDDVAQRESIEPVVLIILVVVGEPEVVEKIVEVVVSRLGWLIVGWMP